MKRLFILLAAVCAIALTACTGTTDGSQTYTVKFETGEGTQIKSQTVKEGAKAVKPAADPEREGHDFAGWYSDDKYWTEYTFKTPVTDNITLYAKWTPKKYTIIFETNGGSGVTKKYPLYNETITKPNNPEKAGYEFAGWYTDAQFTTEFSFETKIKQNYTLYAKWTKPGEGDDANQQGGTDNPGNPEEQKPTVTHIVTFETNGGPTIPPATVVEGESVTRPEDPERAGYYFAGWYTDNGCGWEFNFSRPINSNITLFGKWVENDYLLEQSYIEPSNTHYPDLNEFPKFIDSTKDAPGPGDEGFKAEDPKTTEDGLLTITPQSNGIKVHVNYKTEGDGIADVSEHWRRNNIVFKDKETGEELSVREIAITMDGEGEDAKPESSEIVFPFTEAGRQYEVWFEHEGLEGHTNPLGDWGDTKGNLATVTAIGGEGQFHLWCENIDYSVNMDGSRKIEIKKFERTMPRAAYESGPVKIWIRAESGTRWENPADVCEREENNSLSGAVITINNTDLKAFLDGKQQLFLVIRYKFTYNGQTFQQEIYANYDYDDDNGEHFDNWIVDNGLPVDTNEINKFPLIKIDSSVEGGNGGSNNFVTEPIAHLVKDVMVGWDGSAYNIPDPDYVKCNISVTMPGESEGAAVEGNVKVRGNWTTGYDKKSLRIKFKNKQNLCGLNGGNQFKSWVLLSVFKDASLMRDYVAYKMFKEMFPDYYASDCCFVELVVNNTYMGVYLLAEQQQADEHRINISEPDKNSPDTQIGYLLEFDSYYNTEAENERFEINYRGPIYDYYGTQLEDVNIGYTIKSDVYNVAQKNFITTYMNNLWRICYNAANKNIFWSLDNEYKIVDYVPANENETDEQKAQNCINAVIDTTSLANAYIFNEIICDPDLYWSSFFMDIDFGPNGDKKLRFEAPWDFDSTMGNKRFCIENASECFDGDINSMFAGKCQPDVNGNGSTYGNPWMMLLINEPWFKQLVKTQWAAINKTTLKTTLISYIDNNTDPQYDYVFNKTRELWGNPGYIDELCSASKTAAETSHAASVEYFKNWLLNRIDAVDEIISNLQ